ncbi:hypothetical protein AK812_SmicGene24553 [Symbiodinium microadriaticum]|uniref:Uncharacterized protein n=1 Tax=Symbiodinium microadriaticum TaxID=2951 RepID=A0A1Q9DEC6_SYMMI|nr:hypothetical protein AK812_SmicGene24553 [Symbiodinium microadriaticum]
MSMRSRCRNAELALASATFWKRTVAPFVVERNPRCRSVPNFPGFDPARDRNYFDWRPATAASRTSNKSTTSSMAPQRVGQAQLMTMDRPGSRPTTGQHF